MVQEPFPSEAFVMTSPVLKPYMLVTYGNSSVVVQSVDRDHIVGGAADITRDIISVTAHGMIAHGNGTHIERRLSRLPRERDLHVIPFFRVVVYMANIIINQCYLSVSPCPVHQQASVESVHDLPRAYR